MKRSAQSTSLSLVPAETSAHYARSDVKAATLKESFDDWLNSVAPTLLNSTTIEDHPKAADRWRRALTTTDIMRVNRVTVRESTDHRHWPPEVVISFLAAEVIKRR